MDAANAGKTRLGPRHALAGLEAGIFGTVLMTGWLMLASVLNHRSMWSVPNLFASTFYGANVYRDQLLKGTWSGLALMLVIYGGGGVVWGVVSGERRRPLAAVYGAIAGMLVYYAFFDLIWKHVNPLLVLYGPDRQLEVGHVLWGMALARSPRYARRIAAVAADEPQAEAEIRSGEVIL